MDPAYAIGGRPGVPRPAIYRELSIQEASRRLVVESDLLLGEVKIDQWGLVPGWLRDQEMLLLRPAGSDRYRESLIFSSAP